MTQVAFYRPTKIFEECLSPSRIRPLPTNSVEAYRRTARVNKHYDKRGKPFHQFSPQISDKDLSTIHHFLSTICNMLVARVRIFVTFFMGQKHGNPCKNPNENITILTLCDFNTENKTQFRVKYRLGTNRKKWFTSQITLWCKNHISYELY